MDKSQAVKIVKRELPRYQKLLNLPHWVFNIEYKWIGDEGDCVYGNCTPDPDYNNAYITINAELIKDEEDLCRTLRHEMLHVMHAEFEIYRRAVAHLTTRQEYNALGEIFRSCCEKTVKQLEFVLQEVQVPLMKPKPKKKRRRRK